MKKHIFTILLGLFALTVLGQHTVQISGTIEGLKTPQAVKLFKVVNGTSKEIATSIPQGDELTFGFAFYPEYEGFYGVGLGNEGSPNNNFKFYFKPGDRLDFTITFENSSLNYHLNGDANSKENILLTEWHDLIFPLEDKAINFMGKNSTYVDYFPQQENIAAKATTFMLGKSSGNATFDQLMTEIIRWDLVLFATNFLNTPRSAHPSIEEYSPFYSTLNTQDFSQNTTAIYGYPYGFRTLGGLLSVNKRMAGQAYTPGVQGLAEDLEYVSNDTLKGDVLLGRLENVRSFNDYKDLTTAFERFLLTDAQKKKAESILLPLLEYKPGSDAYAFAYPDIDGNTVTMASLKGKVVLLDVWATWCGPCLAEVPHLKNLEEEFKDTDVQIVSISVDEEKDKEKWKKMIAEKELGGIQLFASGWSEITKYYQIKGIPRFMVFDKEGKIVTIDAPRPSDPKLTTLLKQELAK